MIMAGRVIVDGEMVDKAGEMVRAESDIEVLGPPIPYVSRGGVKLEGALLDLGLDVSCLRCLDIGASTGGFTDCLLQHGAERVYAVDVGSNLIDYSLRKDERVIVIEKVNVRYAPLDLIPEQVDLVTIDVSFISLTLIIPPVRHFLKAGGYMLTLVKPQFELSRDEVGRKGVVRDETKRIKAVEKIEGFLSKSGFVVERTVPSRITGPAGNQEYFVLSSYVAPSGNSPNES